jgi:hypothetical protein
MDNMTLDDRIQELKDLRIRDGKIITELEQVLNTTSITATGHQENIIIPLINKNPTSKTGDRIYRKSVQKYPKPMTARQPWTEAKESLAVVTKVSGD